MKISVVLFITICTVAVVLAQEPQDEQQKPECVQWEKAGMACWKEKGGKMGRKQQEKRDAEEGSNRKAQFAEIMACAKERVAAEEPDNPLLADCNQNEADPSYCPKHVKENCPRRGGHRDGKKGRKQKKGGSSEETKSD